MTTYRFMVVDPRNPNYPDALKRFGAAERTMGINFPMVSTLASELTGGNLAADAYRSVISGALRCKLPIADTVLVAGSRSHVNLTAMAILAHRATTPEMKPSFFSKVREIEEDSCVLRPWHDFDEASPDDISPGLLVRWLCDDGGRKLSSCVRSITSFLATGFFQGQKGLEDDIRGRRKELIRLRDDTVLVGRIGIVASSRGVALYAAYSKASVVVQLDTWGDVKARKASIHQREKGLVNMDGLFRALTAREPRWGFVEEDRGTRMKLQSGYTTIPVEDLVQLVHRHLL